MPVSPASYVEAISARYPDTKVYSGGEPHNYYALVWEGGTALPTQAECDTLVIAETKVRQWRAIQAQRDFLRDNGVKIGANWFHADPNSRIQQLGLVMFGAAMPVGIMWKTMTGAFVPMTPTLAMQIFGGHAQHDTVLFTIAEQKLAAVNALTVLADVAAYNALAGWPETFTGAT